VGLVGCVWLGGVNMWAKRPCFVRARCFGGCGVLVVYCDGSGVGGWWCVELVACLWWCGGWEWGLLALLWCCMVLVARWLG